MFPQYNLFSWILYGKLYYGFFLYDDGTNSTIALTVVKRGKCPDIFSAAIPPIWAIRRGHNGGITHSLSASSWAVGGGLGEGGQYPTEDKRPSLTQVMVVAGACGWGPTTVRSLWKWYSSWSPINKSRQRRAREGSPAQHRNNNNNSILVCDSAALKWSEFANNHVYAREI